MKRHDAKALGALLVTPLEYNGAWFPDAACAKRFGGAGVVKPKDRSAFAACLAKLVPMLSTRISGSPQGALITVEPGIEIDVVFDEGGHVRWLTPAGADDDSARPMLTAQAFEALRTGGTTLLDDKVAELETELGKANPTSAWIRTCLDASGAATRTVAWASTPRTGEVFLRATSDWQLRPFVYRKVATPVCSLSLLTYPAARAPSLERLPRSSGPRVTYSWEDDLEVADPSLLLPSIATIQPAELAALSSTPLVPAPATPTQLSLAPPDRISSINVCIDIKGAVHNVVTLDQQPGDRMRAGKIWRWRFKPYLRNGVPTPACALLQFLVTP